MRIVSLVPSLTETVCWLGLRDQLVGCTNFCVHPPGLHKQATLIGGPKDPDIEQILSLSPTHILTNEEENLSKDIQRLEHHQAGIKVLRTFPKSPSDAPELLRQMVRFFALTS